MTPEAYLYISVAYFSIAMLTLITLSIKGYINYKKRTNKYCLDEFKKKEWKPIQYILHLFHVPPYLIASYWYYDAYIGYSKKYQHEI